MGVRERQARPLARIMMKKTAEKRIGNLSTGRVAATGNQTTPKLREQPREKPQEKEEKKTDLFLSLSSLSLINLESFLNSRFDFALSDWTSAHWRNQRRHERFSSLWPCSRWEATLVQTFQVLVRVSLSLICPRGENDLLPCARSATTLH